MDPYFLVDPAHWPGLIRFFHSITPVMRIKAPGFEDILDIDAVLKLLHELNDRFTIYEPVPSEG